MKYKYLFFLSFILLFNCQLVKAEITCTATITDLVKWEGKQMAIMLKNTGRWIQLPNDTDYKSMALTAFSAGKRVTVYWSESDINTCKDGWEHYRVLKGYLLIKRE